MGTGTKVRGRAAGAAAGVFLTLAAAFGLFVPITQAAHSLSEPCTTGGTCSGTSPITIRDTINSGETNGGITVMCLGVCTSSDCTAGDFSGADSIDYWCIDESWSGGSPDGTHSCQIEAPVGTVFVRGGAWGSANSNCTGAWGYGNFEGVWEFTVEPWYTASILPTSGWPEIITGIMPGILLLGGIVIGIFLVWQWVRRVSR